MIVLKFGGTSVGKPERMKKIAELVLGTPGKKIVVLSALIGYHQYISGHWRSSYCGPKGKSGG